MKIKIRIQIQIHIAITIQIQFRPLCVCKSQLPNWLSLPDKSSSQTDTCIALVGGKHFYIPTTILFDKSCAFFIKSCQTCLCLNQMMPVRLGVHVSKSKLKLWQQCRKNCNLSKCQMCVVLPLTKLTCNGHIFNSQGAPEPQQFAQLMHYLPECTIIHVFYIMILIDQAVNITVQKILEICKNI